MSRYIKNDIKQKYNNGEYKDGLYFEITTHVAGQGAVRYMNYYDAATRNYLGSLPLRTF
jgi:hypothetical protein